jgi:sialic acid synthase SpsE
VARRAIAAGERFTRENVAIKRPLPGRVGLPPNAYERVLGLAAARALGEDDPITETGIAGAA